MPLGKMCAGSGYINIHRERREEQYILVRDGQGRRGRRDQSPKDESTGVVTAAAEMFNNEPTSPELDESKQTNH